MRKSTSIYLYAVGTFLMFVLSAASCGQRSGKDTSSGADDTPLRIHNEQIGEIENIDLSASADTLLAFSDTYPVGVRVSNGNIIIKNAMSDTCIHIYDKNTLELKWKTGVSGNGPEDVLTPSFFASVIPDSLGRFRMADVSDNSLIYIDVEGKNLNKAKMPDYVGFCSSINMLDKYCVAARNNDECMFYIHDEVKNETVPELFDVDCGENIRSKLGKNVGYMLSGMTYANEAKDRIIVPHYFFDIYSVYDLSGKLLKKICLSAEDFNEQEAAGKLIEDKGYIGYTHGFASADACYLLRGYSVSSRGEPEFMQIVKTDWEGTPLTTYYLDNTLTGDFCVDGDDLYGIAKVIDNDEESYMLLRWNLQMKE